ncbi:MAG: hypothetical protein ACLUQ6_11350 [Alistipes onderdonkii]
MRKWILYSPICWAYDAPYLDDQTRKGIASGLEQCRKIARLPRTEVIDRSREGSPARSAWSWRTAYFT